MYGPITSLRRDNRLMKHIPWTAFKMTDLDWDRVVDVRDILAVSTLFSCGNGWFKLHSTVLFLWETTNLWHVLPALEELQTAWEKKRDAPKYGLYHDALTDGLAKIGKYYSRLDEKPSFILGLGKNLLLSRCILIWFIYSASSILQAHIHQALMGWSQWESCQNCSRKCPCEGLARKGKEDCWEDGKLVHLFTVDSHANWI